MITAIKGLTTTKPTKSPAGDDSSTMTPSPAGDEKGTRPYTEPYPNCYNKVIVITILKLCPNKADSALLFIFS